MSHSRYPLLARRWLRSFVRKRRHRDAFQEIETIALFVGYRRSGHSLVGALLDAHPDAAMAHGLDVLLHVRYGFSRDQIFTLMLENSRARAEDGRVVTGYSYAVPGQWQGRNRRLRVLGSTRGGATARTLRDQPEAAERADQVLGLPVRWIHVVRNPYDNISTLALRGRRKDLDEAIREYFRLVAGVARLRDRVGAERILDIRHEDLLASPEATLRRLAGGLGLEAPEDWLRDCRAILFDAPRRTREDAPWTPERIEQVAKAAERHPVLADYRFDT